MGKIEATKRIQKLIEERNEMSFRHWLLNVFGSDDEKVVVENIIEYYADSVHRGNDSLILFVFDNPELWKRAYPNLCGLSSNLVVDIVKAESDTNPEFAKKLCAKIEKHCDLFVAYTQRESDKISFGIKVDYGIVPLRNLPAVVDCLEIHWESQTTVSHAGQYFTPVKEKTIEPSVYEVYVRNRRTHKS